MKVLHFILVFTLARVSYSLKTQPAVWSGFDLLKIGADFQLIPVANQFTKIDRNTYFIKNFQLSAEVGYVNDVYVHLNEGKIYKVSFNAVEYTRTANIEKVLSEFVVNDSTPENMWQQFQLFRSQDRKLGFTKFPIPDHTIAYSYYDHKNKYRTNKHK